MLFKPLLFHYFKVMVASDKQQAIYQTQTRKELLRLRFYSVDNQLTLSFVFVIFDFVENIVDECGLNINIYYDDRAEEYCVKQELCIVYIEVAVIILLNNQKIAN